MKLTHRIGVLALAVSGIVACAQPSLARNETVTSAAGVIQAQYAELAKSSKLMAVSIGMLCDGGQSPGLLFESQRRFRSVVEDWSRIETVRFGPVVEGNRLDRMLYWPDRKGIGLRQVQAALANDDTTVTDVKSLQGKSVAMQGLGALEFLLFGTGSEQLAEDEPDPHRCAYARAVAGNISTISQDLANEWADPKGFTEVWANPGPDNPSYRTDSESMSELLDVFIQGLEMIRDVRINGFFGASEETDKPKQAIYWRSEMTAQSLAANLDGLRALYGASLLTDDVAKKDAVLDRSIVAILNTADSVLSDLPAAIADVLANPDQRRKLERFKGSTSVLSRQFGVDVASKFGLSAGFSSLDGD